jgi:hypothetical protein
MKHEVNMTFCGPARDMVLINRQTEKLNLDTFYINNQSESSKLTNTILRYYYYYHNYYMASSCMAVACVTDWSFN